MSGREKISEQLSAYLDGELSEGESRRIAEMVAGDPDLSAELESLRAVRSLMRSLQPVRAPDGMADAVLKRAHRQPAWWWTGYLGRAAVVLLAVGVGITITAWLNNRPTHLRPAGRQRPYSEKTPVLAKGRITSPAKPAAVKTTNVFINTDNLLLTQREVERVFGNNRIKPIAAIVGKPKTVPAPISKANFYNQTQVTPKRVRYEVAITDNQMRRIVSELNKIRARQSVSQMPIGAGAVSDSEALLADDGYRYKSTEDLTGRRSAYQEKGKADKERPGVEARLERNFSGREFAKVGGRARKAASQPAMATAMRNYDSARVSLTAAKPPGSPTTTTMPASAVAAKRDAGGIWELMSVSRQPATMPTANIRQLVVIINGVGSRQ